jgi:hypothetical protein
MGRYRGWGDIVQEGGRNKAGKEAVTRRGGEGITQRPAASIRQHISVQPSDPPLRLHPNPNKRP